VQLIYCYRMARRSHGGRATVVDRVQGMTNWHIGTTARRPHDFGIFGKLTPTRSRG